MSGDQSNNFLPKLGNNSSESSKKIRSFWDVLIALIVAISIVGLAVVVAWWDIAKSVALQNDKTGKSTSLSLFSDNSQINNKIMEMEKRLDACDVNVQIDQALIKDIESLKSKISDVESDLEKVKIALQEAPQEIEEPNKVRENPNA